MKFSMYALITNAPLTCSSVVVDGTAKAGTKRRILVACHARRGVAWRGVAGGRAGVVMVGPLYPEP